jgi:murein L,D-transpeptidase YcbB/YkuD
MVLRERLGLPREGGFDEALRMKLAAYQQAHGLGSDGVAGAATLRSLNRGAAYHERRILLNMERARRLPAAGAANKYILVDAGSARLWMYEDGRPVDSMKVIVGASATETPMLAALIRYAAVNPYWNVPPELVQSLIAPRVISEGNSYLAARGYEVLDSWEDNARVIGPDTVDWRAVANGDAEVRVRQLPGAGNSMGDIKFMMPNEYGIYLHDTPNRALFAQENRWVSNGCVRVEDARRLARWLFGEMPASQDTSRETRVELATPVPVYITYLTVAPDRESVAFRSDPYQRDDTLLARFEAVGDGMTDLPDLTVASTVTEPALARVARETAPPAPAKRRTATTATPASGRSVTRPAVAAATGAKRLPQSTRPTTRRAPRVSVPPRAG